MDDALSNQAFILYKLLFAGFGLKALGETSGKVSYSSFAERRKRAAIRALDTTCKDDNNVLFDVSDDDKVNKYVEFGVKLWYFLFIYSFKSVSIPRSKSIKRLFRYD